MNFLLENFGWRPNGSKLTFDTYQWPLPYIDINIWLLSWTDEVIEPV